MDSLFGGWRAYRRLRRGTWTLYRTLVYTRRYHIDYRGLERREPMERLPGYLTVLAVERW